MFIFPQSASPKCGKDDKGPQLHSCIFLKPRIPKQSERSSGGQIVAPLEYSPLMPNVAFRKLLHSRIPWKMGVLILQK